MRHPYVPNAADAPRREMLDAIGLPDMDALYKDIPCALRLGRPLQMPPRIASEAALERHVTELLAKNVPCSKALSFLGAGCYQRHIPAVCEEIANRSEFRSAYAGEPYDDFGRFQALFEYESLMGELLDCDVVNVPAMDGAQAAATAIRMAERMTGRRIALVSTDIHPDKKRIIQNYATPAMDIRFASPERLASALDESCACVYVESPSFLGVIPANLRALSDIAHGVGAEMIVGCEPSLLGVLESPMNLGADIVTGDIQSLGNPMNYGGSQAGFIGTRDETRYVSQYPSRLFGITRTEVAGEYGFGDVAYERTSFADRAHAKEYVGTQAALMGITAGVYLALMGPDGMRTLGKRLFSSAAYLKKRLAALPGVRLPFAHSANEFVVDFTQTGKTVGEISDALYLKGIYPGFDLTRDFPELGQSMLVCASEIHEQCDLDRLIDALSEVLQ
ncbi:MAG: aminomethyl-transferring glycine dehydrogenase subunit GcvPA [Clostridia bacterium]